LMSPKRLVTTRWFGLPLTLWNSTGQPPSRCFCSPVTSRSGSTSFSVSMRSPCARSHSSVARRSRQARLVGVAGCAAFGFAGLSLCAGCCIACSWGLTRAQYDESRPCLEGSSKRVLPCVVAGTIPSAEAGDDPSGRGSSCDVGSLPLCHVLELASNLSRTATTRVRHHGHSPGLRHPAGRGKRAHATA